MLQHHEPEVFVYLKSNIEANMDRLNTLSNDNFNILLDEVNAQYCHDLAHYGSQLRRISTCLLYAEFVGCFAVEADDITKNQLIFFTEEQDGQVMEVIQKRAKQHFDHSLEYLKTTLENHFRSLDNTPLNFGHCCDLSYYNLLLKMTADSAVRKYAKK